MKKKKNSPSLQALEAEHHLSDSLEENKVIQWIATHRQECILGFLILVVGTLLFFKLTDRSYMSATRDYLQVENHFDSLMRNPSLAEDETISELVAFVKKHPELQARYDGQLAQLLINQGDFSTSAPIADRAMNRTIHDTLPFYGDFAQITLLINDEQYENALDQSKQLHEKLRESARTSFKEKTDRPFGDLLFAYNLLRVGMLQQKLNKLFQEKYTWTEWQRYAKEPEGNLINGIDPRGFHQIMRQFEEGNISLNDYFTARIQDLESRK